MRTAFLKLIHMSEDASQLASPGSAIIQRTSLWQRLMDWLFGRDFFISYRWSDGRSYAVALFAKLRKERFDCFLDSDGFLKGDNWQRVGDRELRKTSRLVLIGTPEVHASKAVAQELKSFGGKAARIIAISFGDSLSKAKYPDSPVLAALDENAIRVIQPLDALAKEPSDEIIADLGHTFTGETTATRRLRAIQVVAGVLFGLFLVAGVSATIALLQKQEAIRQEKFAKSRQFAAEADLQLSRDPTLLPGALLKAIEATEQAITIESIQTLRHALNLTPSCLLKFPAVDYDEDIVGVQYFPAQKLWVTVTLQGSIVLMNASGQTERHQVAKGATVGNVSFDPVGGRVMVSGVDSGLVVFSADARKVIWSSKADHPVQQISVHWPSSQVLCTTQEGLIYRYFGRSQKPGATAFQIGQDSWQSATWAGDQEAYACSEKGLFHIQLTGKEPTVSLVFPHSFEGVYRVKYNSVGNYVALAAIDSQWLWTPRGNKPVQLSVGWSMSIDTTSDGRMVAVGGKDAVRVYAVDENGNTTPMYSHATKGAACTVLFSSDARFLAICIDSGYVEILETESGRTVNYLISRQCYTAAFSDDSSLLITGGKRGTVWRINERQIPCSPRGSSMDMSMLSRGFSFDSSAQSLRIAIGDSDGSVNIADASSGNLLSKIKTGSWVNTVKFSPSGAVLATGSRDGSVRVLDATTFKEVASWGHLSAVETIDFSSDGALCVTGSMTDPSLRVWRTKPWESLADIPFSKGTTFARFVDGGKQLAVADAEGSIWLLNIKDLSKKLLAERTGTLTDLSLSSDGGKLALASSAGVLILDCHGTLRSTRFADGQDVRCVALSGDGRFVAYSPGGDVLVWDLEAKRQVKCFHNDGYVDDVLFDSSGELLLSGGDPQVIHVWSMREGSLVDSIWQQMRPEKLMLSKDGQFVFAGGSYSSPWITRWRPDAMLDEARTRLRAITDSKP